MGRLKRIQAPRKADMGKPPTRRFLLILGFLKWGTLKDPKMDGDHEEN